jgi:hypothetical protein
MRATAIGAALLAIVAAAVIAANFFLLSFAVDRHDPVGKLSPRTNVGKPPTGPPPGEHAGGESDD